MDDSFQTRAGDDETPSKWCIASAKEPAGDKICSGIHSKRGMTVICLDCAGRNPSWATGGEMATGAGQRRAKQQLSPEFHFCGQA
jgi:hypothetical protein